MPYTLAKMLVWIVLAVGLGVITGWLLRNVTARRQIGRARNHRGDHGEVERLRGRITTLESTIAARDRRIADLEAGATEPGVDEAVQVVQVVDVSPEPAPPPPVDPVMAEARAVLGSPITADDLTVVVGIGPNVEELCHGIGIRTWADLASTEVSLLQTMLVDAGARFKTHDPSTWPRQAELLARGDWGGFKTLHDDLVAPSDASTS